MGAMRVTECTCSHRAVAADLRACRSTDGQEYLAGDTSTYLRSSNESRLVFVHASTITAFIINNRIYQLIKIHHHHHHHHPHHHYHHHRHRHHHPPHYHHHHPYHHHHHHLYHHHHHHTNMYTTLVPLSKA
ncbi:hypothetical protein HZH66_009215 [Vespula vulgaris]|uniref:Uncharacterized protein n=1 Tax=Vespula vulgaris TaxID=7454 RepID=A0A834MZ54_VESVU|nr:hypothetical protein HZH66_009215 [Vespula vulgaris]